MRARTSQGQMLPTDAALIAEEFGRVVRETAEEIGAKKIWNADETGVPFDLLPARTVDEKGAKTVWVWCSAAQKRRVSVLLLLRRMGKSGILSLFSKRNHRQFQRWHVKTAPSAMDSVRERGRNLRVCETGRQCLLTALVGSQGDSFVNGCA